MNPIIEAAARNGDIQKTPLAQGVTRVAAQPGMSYRLAGVDGSRPIAKRVGDDLVVEGLPEGRKIVLEGFYLKCADGDSCSMAFAQQDDSTPAAILLPSTAPLATLADGSLLMYPVGGDASAMAATAAATGGSSGILMPALAVLGGLAIAAGGGGGGGDTATAAGEPTPPPAPPTPPTPADTTAPAVPSLVAAALTNDNTPTITGTAEAGSTVKLYDGATLLATVVAEADGTWSWTPDTALPDANYSLSAAATDAAGNTSAASDPVTMQIDTTAPEAPSLSAAALTNDNTPTITGTAEAGSTVKLYDGATLLATVVAEADGTWSWTPDTALPDANYSLSATATDAAGNTSAVSEAVGMVIDTAAPEAPELIAPALTNDNTPAISGTAEPGSTVKIYNGDVLLATVVAVDGNWSWTPESSLGDGTYALTATATDAAGNTGPASAAVAMVIDATAPATPTVDLIGATNDNTPLITGTAVIGEGEQLAVTVDGQTYTTANGLVIDGARWELAVGPLLDGSYDVEARVTDAAGNESTDTSTDELVIDTAPPVYPLISAEVIDDKGSVKGVIANGGTTDDSKPELRLTLDSVLESGETLLIYREGDSSGVRVLAGQATLQADSTYVFEDNLTILVKPGEPTIDTTYTYTAEVVDAAGNVGDVGLNYTITFDLANLNSI